MIKKLLAGISGGTLAAIAVPLAVAAAGVITVTPANTQGWSTADTRPGGTVTFVNDPSSPMPSGALQLTTDLTTTAKAQYMHATNVPLSSVNTLSYATKQLTPAGPVADPSYQLPVYLNGTSGFTTLVYEPYQNPQQGAVIPGAWQTWNVAAGLFWSTRTVTCSNGTILGTPGGPASYTLAQIKSACPSAVVLGYGVNIGSNNPGYTVRTDAFNFNGTIYNFEATPSSTRDCKNGGYAKFTNPSFKNQGQCVKYYEQHHYDRDHHDYRDSDDEDDLE